ncbi:MAG: hypothetical protein U1E87_10730 [Alphaproteobacteria bacterium]
MRDSARLLSLTERNGDGAVFPPAGFVAGPDKTRLTIAVSTLRLDGKECAARGGPRGSRGRGRSLQRPRPSNATFPSTRRAFPMRSCSSWAAGAFSVAQAFHEKSGAWPDDKVLEPWTLGLSDLFRAQPPDALPKALAHLQAAGEEIEAFFKDVDVILTPVVDGAAPYRMARSAPALRDPSRARKGVRRLHARA